MVYVSYVTKLSLCANCFQQQVISEDMLVHALMKVPGIARHHDSTVMTSGLRMHWHRPHCVLWCCSATVHYNASAQYSCTTCSVLCCGLSQGLNFKHICNEITRHHQHQHRHHDNHHNNNNHHHHHNTNSHHHHHHHHRLHLPPTMRCLKICKKFIEKNDLPLPATNLEKKHEKQQHQGKNVTQVLPKNPFQNEYHSDFLHFGA